MSVPAPRKLRYGGILAATALAVTGLSVTGLAGPASGADHDKGRMGPRNAARTTVDPRQGPDWEMPFVCGQSWTGTTRSGHSPSYYTIDWNTPYDLGKPALASAPGVVTRAVTLTGSYGRYVVVDHGGGYSTLYAHLNQIMVSVGQVLDQGDLVGFVGGSGNVTGPHLHFEERKDGAYFPPYLHRTRYSFGTTQASALCNDRPLAGDWDGDGTTDVGAFRSTASGGRFKLRRPDGTVIRQSFGGTNDVPLAADFDGDRVSQVGVRKLGSPTWLLRSKSGATATVTGAGLATDLPVTGDWDGNGLAELGWYRPSSHTFYLRSASGQVTSVAWGASGQQPVTGDWDGDGTTDLGSWEPSTGTWRLRVRSGSGFTTQSVRYGVWGDQPVTGDWDGDGTTDLGLWRPASGQFQLRTLKGTTAQTTTVGFGRRRG